MEASLKVPTATSVRTFETAALEAHRASFNAANLGVKATFGHVITFAIVTAAAGSPMMRTYHAGAALDHADVNVGVAVDVNGSLVVPVIRAANRLSFVEFVTAYDAVVAKALAKQLTVDEMQGATISVTNPGGLGTSMSVPRLMEGQAAIVGVGAITVPHGFSATDPAMLAQLHVSRICTMTSTYDHRVIQGADSGRFLRTIDELLQGAHDFYVRIGATRPAPAATPAAATTATPATPATTSPASAKDGQDAERALRLQRWQDAWFELGHSVADLNPLSPPVTRPELDLAHYGLSADAEALAVLDQLAQEPEMHRRHFDCYAYEFFVVRK
jgi:2-oxoglutarate dehydrogenase E1 component